MTLPLSFLKFQCICKEFFRTNSTNQCNHRFQLQKQVADNRKFLTPIVDTIILCGRVCIPLRGHRDDSKYHPEVGNFSTGSTGNFIDLLNYRVRGGDTTLENHLLKCNKNSSYISKTSQNEIINCCADIITENIVSEVKKNKFFTIIADEASDTSNKEQLSLVLRYVDSNFDIKEDFIRFLHCKEGLSGSALASIMLKALSDDPVLNVQDCRGQGYDGAGAVAGRINGLSAHILRINRKAIYTHCHSHRLNLCICASCSVQTIRNVLDNIKEISYFFNFSQVREDMFVKNIELYAPDSLKNKLKDVCRTRWIERVEGMDTFQELYVPLVFTLEEMFVQRQCNIDTSSKALSLYKLITSFDFIITMVITRSVFDITLPVTQMLQSKSNDIFEGLHMIDALKSAAMATRNAVDAYREMWYEKAVSLAQKVCVTPTKPRTCGRQKNRSNIPAENISDYFKRTTTIPMLDHLNSELKLRFDISTVTSYQGLSIIPSKMMFLVSKHGLLGWKDKFTAFCSFYSDDMPNFLALDAELDLWHKYWEMQDSYPDNISATLKAIPSLHIDNLTVALRILATLPVTSCEFERSFFAMRRLKNYNRSTMVADRLNGLALLHIHKEFVPSTSSVINKFAVKNRRLDFNFFHLPSYSSYIQYICFCDDVTKQQAAMIILNPLQILQSSYDDVTKQQAVMIILNPLKILQSSYDDVTKQLAAMIINSLFMRSCGVYENVSFLLSRSKTSAYEVVFCPRLSLFQVFMRSCGVYENVSFLLSRSKTSAYEVVFCPRLSLFQGSQSPF
ncbi:52 kDa repressor of the inhibitor of the protein kinase-like [Hydractinia symbiolongicarpus]|uniref:52 kDa repressor of the inhibitor of the protein kinase-like n=1 Tax=Hydractinia symbiolongicarpus TaxID=13093 RepID=UPI002550CB7B|nr:52 kDa repressor of the inhibitor of the protein kinase-like [Hydractinia symbiolongicarpus]